MYSRLFQLSKKWYLAAGWTIFTQILLSLPGSLFRGPGLFKIPHLDKIVHVFLFAGLAMLWILYYRGKKEITAFSVALILLIVSAYGVAVEFFQVNFIPNRSFDVWDIVADIAGAVCGFFATIFIVGRYKKNMRRDRDVVREEI